jgi:hypothetical protein
MIRLDNQDSRRNNSQTSDYQRYTTPINIHLEFDIYGGADNVNVNTTIR